MANTNTTDTLKELEQYYVDGNFKEFRDALMKKKGDLDPGLFHYNLGTSYAKEGDLGAARYNFEKAKDHGFINPLLRKNLEVVKTQVEDYEKLLTIKDKSLDFLIDSPASYFVTFALIFSLLLIGLAKSMKLFNKWVALAIVCTSIVPYFVKTQYLNARYFQAVNIKPLKIYEGPSDIYSVVKEVPPGLKLTIGKSFEEWILIELPSDHAGWIKRKDVGIL